MEKLVYGNPDIHMSDFAYFSHIGGNGDIYYSLVWSDKELVGVAKLWGKGMWRPETYAISFMSIHHKYIGRGFATSLAKEIFRWAKEKNVPLSVTDYSFSGWHKLKPLFNELSKQMGVEFYDTDSKLLTTRGEKWEEDPQRPLKEEFKRNKKLAGLSF